jgi:signal transduction histidine kinase
MEKLSNGTVHWYELVVQPIRKVFSDSKQGWEKLFKKPSIKFRTYTGVAGIIRRRMVMSITVALFSGSFAILVGFFLYAMNMVNIAEAIAMIGMIFIMGLMLNGWLLLRLMSKPLKDIEHVEDTLVQMADSGAYRLDEDTQQVEYQATPFVQSYHVDNIETHHLEFLAQISHEIRTPLASLLGYAELLTDSELRHDDRFIDTCYHIIRKEGNQVCRLVEDAVLAAGVNSGHYNFEFTNVKLNLLMQFIIDEEMKRTKRSIILENNVGDIEIRADAIGITEAIKKLIDNGVKFSSPEEPVKVVVDYAKNPNWIEISVIDRGVGIDENDKSILFRRFSRIRNAQTEDIPGNGLGLYIANNIILNHNGEISYKSEPEVGSTFTISLPLEKTD